MPAVSAKHNFKGIERSEPAMLVRETRQRLGLSQVKFAEKLGISFQRVNRWENEHTKPLPVALKQIEQLLHQMGKLGKDLLTKHFPARGNAE